MTQRSRLLANILFWTAFVGTMAVYYALLIYFDRTMFSPRPGRIVESIDGFQYSLLAFEAGVSTDELWLAVRYYISWPLLEMDRSGYGSFYQGTYLLLYSMPIILWRQREKDYKYLQLLLILLPVFINFRLAICIYATLYLYIFIVGRASALLLIWYSIALVLSSSTMFLFLLYMPLLGRKGFPTGFALAKIAAVAVYGVVMTEFYGKISRLFERSVSGEVLSTAGDAGLGYAGSVEGFLRPSPMANMTDWLS
jgi:hypothetical protein